MDLGSSRQMTDGLESNLRLHQTSNLIERISSVRTVQSDTTVDGTLSLSEGHHSGAKLDMFMQCF